MNKKGATSLTEAISLIVIFSIIMLGGAAMMGGLTKAYPSSHIDTSFNKTYANIDTITNKTTSMRESFESSGLSITGLALIVTGSWGIILTMFSFALNTMMAIFSNLTEYLGVPDWFTAAIVALIIVSIVLSIIGAMLFKGKEV